MAYPLRVLWACIILKWKIPLGKSPIQLNSGKLNSKEHALKKVLEPVCNVLFKAHELNNDGQISTLRSTSMGNVKPDNPHTTKKPTKSKRMNLPMPKSWQNI